MESKKLSLKLSVGSLAQTSRGGRSFREPIFAFVAAPYKFDGGMRTHNVTELTYCRESFCEYVRQELRDIRHQGIDLNKLHMVAHRKIAGKKGAASKIFQGQMMATQTMANAIEKHYGWPLTRVYPIKVVQATTGNSEFYYITASKRWIKAPAMLSLFTLLIRIAASESKFKFRHRIRSMKSLFAVLDELYTKSSYAEIMYYGKHGHNWKLVLDNYRKLFGSRNMEDLYFPADTNYLFTEGINNLCDVSSKDKTLNDTFKKLTEKNKGTTS